MSKLVTQQDCLSFQSLSAALVYRPLPSCLLPESVERMYRKKGGLTRLHIDRHSVDRATCASFFLGYSTASYMHQVYF